jgi:hypothetical protein
MAYTLTYRQRFKDIHPTTSASWEILFYKKDGPIIDVVELVGTATPLTIEWTNTGDNKFQAIIGSKATIGYMYQGAEGEPVPDVFINIQEDTWLIAVNKNGNLYWKGFLKPDNSSYPFIHPPFEFRMNATDYFQVMKTKTVDLNDPVLFLYDYITLKDVIDRTLFHAVEYDDAVLRLMCTIYPNVISEPSKLLDELYIHTDAFYDFDKGSLPVYDCLNMLCQSLGMRIFYAAGSYWMQRVADLDQQQYNVYTLRPNTPVVQEDIVNVLRQLGTSAPQNDIYYLERTQSVYITPALKEQDYIFNLKGINQLKNFDWRNFTGSQFQPGWSSAGAGLALSRRGTGSSEDPFIARMAGGGNPAVGQFIGQTFPVVSGQHIELNLKGFSYYATGLRINVSLIPGEPGAGAWYLDSGGDWKEDVVVANQEILFSPDKKTHKFTGNIVSKAIPESFSYTLVFNIFGPTFQEDPDPEHHMPPGDTPYNDLYPAFLRIFNNPYTDIKEKIVNSAAYSLKPDELDFFFLDTQDGGLSNTIFYDDAGTKKALPAKNWHSGKNAGIALRDVDEYLAWSYLDAQQVGIYNLEGDVFSNVLEFHNVTGCMDMPGKQFMMLRDKYDVRNCRHSIMMAEVKNEGTATGTYSVKPVISND